MSNRHPTYCLRCNETQPEVLQGPLDRYHVLGNPNHIVAYAKPGAEMRKHLAEKGIKAGKVRLRNGHPVPAEQLCARCIDEVTTFKNEVVKGGVFWHCGGCNKYGVIKADTPLAKATRKEAGIEAPEPCGLQFEVCMEHQNDIIHIETTFQ